MLSVRGPQLTTARRLLSTSLAPSAASTLLVTVPAPRTRPTALPTRTTTRAFRSTAYTMAPNDPYTAKAEKGDSETPASQKCVSSPPRRRNLPFRKRLADSRTATGSRSCARSSRSASSACSSRAARRATCILAPCRPRRTRASSSRSSPTRTRASLTSSRTTRTSTSRSRTAARPTGPRSPARRASPRTRRRASALSLSPAARRGWRRRLRDLERGADEILLARRIKELWNPMIKSVRRTPSWSGSSPSPRLTRLLPAVVRRPEGRRPHGRAGRPSHRRHPGHPRRGEPRSLALGSLRCSHVLLEPSLTPLGPLADPLRAPSPSPPLSLPTRADPPLPPSRSQWIKTRTSLGQTVEVLKGAITGETAAPGNLRTISSAEVRPSPPRPLFLLARADPLPLAAARSSSSPGKSRAPRPEWATPLCRLCPAARPSS